MNIIIYWCIGLHGLIIFSLKRFLDRAQYSLLVIRNQTILHNRVGLITGFLISRDNIIQLILSIVQFSFIL